MILITGGLGFIGSHTARALLELGETCVLAQRRTPALPDFLTGKNDDLVAVRVDLTDQSALLDLGRRYPITGIVHLAGSVPWPPGAEDPMDAARGALVSLLNVLEAGRTWGVGRVSLASTIGVYIGVTADPPYPEDLPLPMTRAHAIPSFKKIGELLGGHIRGVADLEVVNCRIGSIWGPRGHAKSPFFAAPQLVHAAVKGVAPDMSALYAPAYAENGTDLCYVKDCARALALLQTAQRLEHDTYNVSAGQVTTYAELATAVRNVVPAAQIEFPPGRDPNGPTRDVSLDVTRLRKDTGFESRYDIEHAVADYAAWLRAGNET